VQLADLQLELRPRHAWEAVDLGQSMYRRWWWPLQSAWFLTFLPLAVGLGIAFRDRPVFALAILWWLLPFVERAPLFVLGRRAFGESVRPVELLRELPRLLRRRALWRLTVARLSPWRGFAAPIAVLERTGGAAARKRASVLMSGGREGSVAMTVSGVAWSFVLGISFALYNFVGMFLPEFVAGRFADAILLWIEGEPTQWPGLVLYAFVCVAMSVVGPLFVAVNFSLYLNRRIFLEGWDVEVAFRSLAARLSSAGRTGAVLLACVVLVGGGAAPVHAAPVHAAPVHAVTPSAPTAEVVVLAQDEAPAPAASDAPRETVDRVLAHEDFDTTVTRRVPANRDRGELSDGEVSGFLRLLGNVMTVVFVGAAIGGLLYLIYLAAKYAEARRGGGDGSERAPRPVEVAGLDVRPESLPDDPASTALALWRRGEAREALGLLYRAAIARIVDRFEVPIVDGDTEGLCLFRVRTARVPDVETFGELTATWQGCAYGERVPDDAGFDGLVRRWRAAYGAATVAAGAQEAGR